MIAVVIVAIIFITAVVAIIVVVAIAVVVFAIIFIVVDSVVLVVGGLIIFSKILLKFLFKLFFSVQLLQTFRNVVAPFSPIMRFCSPKIHYV